MKIYHHNDLDGRCAAAIALRWTEGAISYRDVELIEVDYKDEIKVNLISHDEEIVIVDFSFKPEVMKGVCERTQNIVWLDHHKTAFEYKYDLPKTLQGIRDINYSGCELAWMWFRINETAPVAVTLIGDYDKWALKLQP